MMNRKAMWPLEEEENLGVAEEETAFAPIT